MKTKSLYEVCKLKMIDALLTKAASRYTPGVGENAERPGTVGE